MFNSEILLAELTKLDPTFANRWSAFIEAAGKKNLSPASHLQQLKIFNDDQLKPILAKAFAVEALTRVPENLAPLTARFLPLALAKANHLAVVEEGPEAVTIVTNNPDNNEVLDLIAQKIRRPLVIMFAYDFEIDKSLSENQGNLEEKFEKLKVGALKDLTSLESLQDSSRLLDVLLISSLQYKASDIHIEPHAKKLIVRFRVDGILEDIIELPDELSEVIITRIKVLASLRTDEHRRAQDGRFKLLLENGKEITTRVSILPVYDGEKVVLRILAEEQKRVELEDLGYTKANQTKVYNNIDKTHGMILVTGPTGSGKTTTLYSILKLLNKPELNLTTIEDPIEYRLDRVNQIQVNNEAGLTFATGLRSILRQDPDVVMVGEIRDEETAAIAVNASLTGHLVLATLHTNSAIDTLPRLLEMRVEPYLIASTVNVIVAQRLIRKLCEECKIKTDFSPTMINSLLVEESEFSRRLEATLPRYIGAGATIYRPGACRHCGDSGYKGRLAIAEVIDVDDSIRAAIFAKQNPLEIEKIARDHGFKDLIEDGLQKVAAGQSALAEVIRVIKE